MRPNSRRRVPVPTEDDINRTDLYAHGLVAFAGTKKGLVIYLNAANRKGGTGILCLDGNGAGRLIAVLKALAPNFAETPASAVTLGDDGDTEAQEGFLPSGGDL
jgi:hypothetical protein